MPTLLSLTIASLTRPRANASLDPEGSGTFWCEAPATEAIPLQPLPLPPETKQSTIRMLRIGGILLDEALLRLTDSAFHTLCLASCRSLSGESLCHLPLLCPALPTLDLSWCLQLRGADIVGAFPPTLRALALRGCFRLEAADTCAALATLPHLTTLRVDGQHLPIVDGGYPRLLAGEAALGAALVSRRTSSAAWSLGNLTVVDTSAGPVDASSLCHALRSAALCVLILHDAPGLDDTHIRTLLGGCRALAHLARHQLPALTSHVPAHRPRVDHPTNSAD